MEFIVAAACGAVSQTYTTQIGENRQDVCVCSDMHPRMNESLGWSACMYVGRGIYFRFSSTPLLVHFGPFYSLYLGQVIPACFFFLPLLSVCLSVCLCGGVCGWALRDGSL